MKDESWSLSGWPAVPVIVMAAGTPVLTALVISLPVSWLINQVFAPGTIHAVFGVEHIGYWRVVGLFAIVFASKFKIELHGPSK
jgi:hypothetical protein